MLKVNFLTAWLLTITAIASVAGWGRQEKVLLRDIQTITLHQGEMTNGRRSSPVLQIKCVGGSAYGMYHPKVVQCYNRGWDGNDIQWECKADMDSSYRFGRIAVSCEGYDHPDDEYILKGSCGLEYELELTEEGRAKKGHGYNYQHSSGSGSGFGTFIVIVVVVVILICVCSKGNKRQQRHDHQQRATAPPPGFRPEFMPGSESAHASAPPPEYPDGPPPPYPGTQSDSSQYSYASAGSVPSGSNTQQSSGGGFWTGAATGTTLGYMFGRGSQPRHRYDNHGNSGWGNWGGNNWGRNNWGGNSWGQSSGSSGSSGGSSNSTSSSSTRTASGFGGTKRR